jgi:hypothetical protein
MTVEAIECANPTAEGSASLDIQSQGAATPRDLVAGCGPQSPQLRLQPTAESRSTGRRISLGGGEFRASLGLPISRGTMLSSCFYYSEPAVVAPAQPSPKYWPRVCSKRKYNVLDPEQTLSPPP